MRVGALAAIIVALLIGQLPAGAAKSSPPTPILLAAGDIADCSLNGARLTAALIDSRPGTVAAIGDTAYPTGSVSDFSNCYQPTWGRFKGRTRPALGNHEYLTAGASAYFAYFGHKAAPPGGYYSYRLGSWHIVVINSNCDQIGGCGPGSKQLRWLQADLAQHKARCSLAYWHSPRFSSGPHGSDETMQPIWAALAKAGADIVLNGHDHLYQRFAPLEASGHINPERGMREFVVGTGGGPFYHAVTKIPSSRKIVTSRWGVLRLKLGTNRYYWRFLSTPNGRVLDAGSSACH
jgi:alkaline phosphatase